VTGLESRWYSRRTIRQLRRNDVGTLVNRPAPRLFTRFAFVVCPILVSSASITLRIFAMSRWGAIRGEAACGEAVHPVVARMRAVAASTAGAGRRRPVTGMRVTRSPLHRELNA
jgi:hypothetical protein